MGLFFERYIMMLLLFVTQSFVTAITSNVTHEQQSIAKVLTRFLKIPWIDLHSSGIDAVTSICRDDIATVFKSADAGELWALQMLDATSKVPAGILTGNIYDVGMFDECIGVKSHHNTANIRGQHCMISLSIPTKFFGDITRMMSVKRLSPYNPSEESDLNLSVSVCMPSSCSIKDINGLVNASIQNMPEISIFEVGIAKVTCTSSDSPSRLTFGSILTLLFFAMVMFLLLFCTVCDFLLRTRPSNVSTVLKQAAAFSLYSNAKNLLNTTSTSGSMPAIHGIRILSICLVIVAHRFAFVIFIPSVNLSDSFEVVQSKLSSLLFTLPFVVETSFLISGFFVTCSFLKAMRSGEKFNILDIYFSRYLRMTPCLAVVILFVIFVLPHLGSGPIWEKVAGTIISNCQKNWWTNPLYISNIVHFSETCLPHTWYLTTEMQLFWLSPMILYPLFYRPKLGLILVGLFMTASFFTPAILLWVNRSSVFFAMYDRNTEGWPITGKYYVAPYNRALSYFTGILLGYDVSYNNRQISEKQVAVNWVLSSLSILFCGWITHHVQPVAIVYNVVWEMTYVSVGRFLWSVAMAWVVYACTQGYGGPVTNFLSLPVFVPLGRISYCVYLVHFVVQVATTGTERIAVYVTPYNVICQFFGDLVVSTVIAFFLCLCIESPVMEIRKILMSRRFPTLAKCDSKIVPASYLAGIEKYLNSARSQATSGVAIETLTSTLDFWQTVSDDLNTLTEGASKTPSEWSKAWKNWRSKLLQIDSALEAYSRPKGVQVEKFQLQTEDAILRRELLVFLAAVNSEVADETSSEKAGITGSKSQSNSNNWLHNDPMKSSMSDEVSLNGKKLN